jgi:hypothetical protein
MTSNKQEFYKKIALLQKNLNCPKNNYNSFGKYSYRSLEDILAAYKIAKENDTFLNNLFLHISDEVTQIGERFYVKAIVTITDGEHEIQSTGYAREDLTKKGMDASQITGACSSYARKYALNGLFCIDDTKDADTDEFQQKTKQEVFEKEIKTESKFEFNNDNVEDLKTEIKQLINGITEDKSEQAEILKNYSFFKGTNAQGVPFEMYIDDVDTLQNNWKKDLFANSYKKVIEKLKNH